MKIRKNENNDIYNLIIPAISLLLSLSLSIFVLSSSPRFIAGGDTASYVAFAKEIIANGFFIPAHNALHFPGSQWIYPPVVPYILALIFRIFGDSGWLPFEIAGILGALLSAITVIPIWKVTNFIFGRLAATIATISFAFYLPNQYALTWGAYPQIFATLLLVMIFYYLVRLSNRKEEHSTRYVIYLSATLAILYLTHDLTSFVVLLSLGIFVLISFLIRYTSYKNEDSRNISFAGIRVLLAVIISSPAFIIWYIPTLWWVKDAAFGSPSTSIVSSNGFSLSSDISSIQQVLFHLNPYIILVGILSILLIASIMRELIESVREEKLSRILSLILFIVIPVILMSWKINDYVLFARFSYYVFPSGLIIVAGLLAHFLNNWHFTNNKSAKNNKTLPRNYIKPIFAFSVLILLSINSVVGIDANFNSHTYFAKYTDNSTTSLQINSLNWINENIPHNSTIVSEGQLGFYIMGFSGLPTLVYEPLNYLTQPTEWNESLAAYILISNPSLNLPKTLNLIYKYNVKYIVVPENITNAPSFYYEIHSAPSLTVYKIK